MKKSKGAFCHTRSFWCFVAPALILFTVFFLVPLMLSLYLSFTNYDGWKKLDFIGVANYIKLFKDIDFYKSLGRTFIYVLFSIPFKVIIPLLIAAVVTSDLLKGKTFVRVLIYLPVLLSALVVGITINWMFGQEYGLVNFLIQNLGGTPLQWAMNSKLATFVISFASNWASTGFFMIIFIGGISNISKELYEAANVDGASKLNAFLKITIPMLSPTIFLVVLLSTVNLLKEYALVQGITMGGPGSSTKFIVQYIFDKGFTQYQYGYASAIGVISMVIFILITLVQFKISKGGGEV